MHPSRLSMKLHLLRRGYATLRETGDNIPDPCLARWPANPRCSPYDILEQGRHARYSKRRFYELVKVYHPDRWQHATYHGISKHTRVERYRLIVAANAILSDPVKRKAYDERGVGWEPDLVSGPDCRTGGACHDKRQRGPADASRNATWEDWEQWRSHQQAVPNGRQKQSAVFICNRSFALILVLFMVVGGCAQLVRADHVARRVAGRQDKIHGVLCEELLEIKSRSVGLSDRRLLVDAFLRKRRMGARCEGVGG